MSNSICNKTYTYWADSTEYLQKNTKTAIQQERHKRLSAENEKIIYYSIDI